MATRKNSRRRSRTSRTSKYASKLAGWAGRQSKRAARWGWKTTWSSTKRAGKWTGRRVIAPAAKKAARVAGRRGRAIGMGVVEAIERRRLTGSARSATYTCGECPGTKFTADQYREHLKGHGKTYAIPARLKNGAAAAELTGKPNTQPGAKPAPATGPASKPAPVAKPVPTPVSSWATPDSGTSPAPAPVTVLGPVPLTPLFGREPSRPHVKTAADAAMTTLTNQWKNSNRSTPAMSNLQQLVRAADALADETPATAEELDDMLGALALTWTKVADAITNYAEMLDSDIRIDPRVTRPIYDGADDVAGLGRLFRDSRTAFRKVYEAEFDAMDSGARKVAVDGFWEAGAA
ncbi:hypothetical protein [Kribbella solani]|uniref:Uncharacterized protein n=1 Tax=Kribbella solani TaxID=236067 RepID=A0A841E4Y8_9ACTN|nr:hypothetical protein [Kribbella solani]MBB5983990.1 hypothetical protein [Kribbella solani]